MLTFWTVVWEHENEAPKARPNETPDAAALAQETDPLIG